MKRLKRFYYRFKNQYKIHHHWAPLGFIIKIAWKQSRDTAPVEFNPTHTDIKTLT